MGARHGQGAKSHAHRHFGLDYPDQSDEFLTGCTSPHETHGFDFWVFNTWSFLLQVNRARALSHCPTLLSTPNIPGCHTRQQPPHSNSATRILVWHLAQPHPSLIPGVGVRQAAILRHLLI